jgi:hypothetical protein
MSIDKTLKNDSGNPNTFSKLDLFTSFGSSDTFRVALSAGMEQINAKITMDTANNFFRFKNRTIAIDSQKINENLVAAVKKTKTNRYT